MAFKAVPQSTPLNRDPVGHRGPNILPLKNISSITANNVGTIQVPVDSRKMFSKLFTSAVYYTGGAGQKTQKITGAGDDALTVTLTLAKYEPSAVAIVAAGTGYAVNDTFSVVDATGQGAVFKVTAVGGGGAVTAATYNANTAIASPMPPNLFFSGAFSIQAGTATPHQVDPLFYIMRSQAEGYFPPLGELPIDFAQPSRNFLVDNDETAWDLVGAKNMTISFRVGDVIKPVMTGEECFDKIRNSFVDARGNKNIFNDPVYLVQQVVDLVAGVTTLNTLAFKGRLLRLWVLCATTPGTISAIEVWGNDQQRVDGSVADVNKFYRRYGFKFGQADNYVQANYASSNALIGAINPPAYFDAAYISDFDGRTQDSLDVVNSHQVKLTSSVAQKATIFIESLPGGFV